MRRFFFRPYFIIQRFTFYRCFFLFLFFSLKGRLDINLGGLWQGVFLESQRMAMMLIRPSSIASPDWL